MESCLYEGRVRHRRRAPTPHAFEYRLFFAYLDLAELTEVFRGRWLWSTTRPAAVRFRREDHLGDPSRPLDAEVRDLVEARTGRRPAGPIRLLTHLRHFGLCFNPVSFYYCFGPDGRCVEAVVAEVTNTPWGERHCYVLGADGYAGATRVHRVAKTFHVSPFMGMDVDYVFRLSPPGDTVGVRIESHDRRRGRLFDATLCLERREICGRSLARALLLHPFLSAKVVAAIYFEALRLWWKRAPFHPHPGARPATPGPEVQEP